METIPEKIEGIPIGSTIDIENKIYIIRNQQVMLDRDLAEIYGVETKRLNEQVKRNSDRFPIDFCFQLNELEFENWRSQFATSNSDKMGLRRAPYAFTEQGVGMLASVLKSETAIKASVKIMRAFVAMRRFMLNNAQIFVELNAIKKHLLAKKQSGVNVTIITSPRTPLTPQDVRHFNTQYPTLTIQYSTSIHDRFLIIDHSVLFHVGASLKDLGKKCFAFEIMEDAARLIPLILSNS